MSLWPTISRMALSATAFTVPSGFWMLNRKSGALVIRQNTTKSTSTMFSSPVSIRLSSGTSRIVARGVADVGRAAHADLDAVDARHLRQLDLLDRIGPAEIQAGRKLADIFAESQHDAELVGVDPHGEAEKADQRDQHHGEQHGERAAHAAARHGLAQPVLAAAQDLFEVGLLAGAGPRAPGPTAAAFPTAAAALIAPRHDEV